MHAVSIEWLTNAFYPKEEKTEVSPEALSRVQELLLAEGPVPKPSPVQQRELVAACRQMIDYENLFFQTQLQDRLSEKTEERLLKRHKTKSDQLKWLLNQLEQRVDS